MSSSDEDFFLLDNIIPKIKRKRFGIHEINKKEEIMVNTILCLMISRETNKNFSSTQG